MKRLLRNIFLRNWGLKLFSFLLAVILWFSVIPKERIVSEKIITVPLELHNIPAGMEVVEKPTSNVDVKIRAPNRLINQLNSACVHAVLDLHEAQIDLTEYPLNKNMISLPQGAEVKDIYPSLVKLRLEKTRQINLEVEAQLVGDLQEGITIQKVECIPPRVPVEGPESILDEGAKVRTNPIDRSTLTESTEKEVDLILPNPNLRFASAQIKVKVRITIESEEVKEEGSDVPPEKSQAGDKKT